VTSAAVAVPETWQVTTVADLVNPGSRSIAIGPFGSRMKADLYVSGGVPVVRGNNITNSRTPTGNFVYVSEEVANSMPGCLLYPGDLVFPHRGAIGEVGLIGDSVAPPLMLSTSLMKLTPDRRRVDSLFLYYYFHSEPGRRELLMRASTVGTPGIGQPLASLRSITVPLPPLGEQRAIAATLGALDDKIESNRRAQITGEQLTRAIVERALASAWSAPATSLGGYCSLVKSVVAADHIDGDANYIGFEHMPRGSIFLNEWSTADGLGSHKSQFETGDVLFGRLRPYFKKVGVAPIGGVCSTDILVLRPRTPNLTALVAIVASSDPLIDALSAGATGTRMPRASWADLAKWPVPRLTEDETAELGRVTRALLEQLTRLTFESQKLAALQDALVPELLSGRIRLPEAANAVAEATA